MALLRSASPDAAGANAPAPITPVQLLSAVQRLPQKVCHCTQCARKIELFFRFFKHVLGCRHLLSHRANGIEIQAYTAIIVCMLIALWTGRAPTLRTVEMIRFYFIGWAEADELEAHIAKLQKRDA